MARSKSPNESFSFTIPSYGLDHQGGAIVDIIVNLDFKKDIGVADPFAYPEFVSIANFIKDYLVEYPNETDFWEILNRNLTQALLTEKIPTTFGVEYNLSEVVDSLTVDIGVESGSSLVNFIRASKVIGSPSSSGIDFDEGFSFEINDSGLNHQGGAVLDFKLDFVFCLMLIICYFVLFSTTARTTEISLSLFVGSVRWF